EPGVRPTVAGCATSASSTGPAQTTDASAAARVAIRSNLRGPSVQSPIVAVIASPFLCIMGNLPARRLGRPDSRPTGHETRVDRKHELQNSVAAAINSFPIARATPL